MPTSSLPGLLPLEAAIQSVSMFFSGQTSPDRSAAQDPVSSPPPTPDTSRYIIIARERSSLYPMDPEILAGPNGCFQTSEVQGALLLGLPPLPRGYRTFLVPSPHPSWALSSQTPFCLGDYTYPRSHFHFGPPQPLF